MARRVLIAFAFVGLASALSCGTSKTRVDDAAGTGEIAEPTAGDVADRRAALETLRPLDVVDGRAVPETAQPQDMAPEVEGPGDMAPDDGPGELDTCQPNCEGKECGSDGCGGSCGECLEDWNFECVEGVCVCVPDCSCPDGGTKWCGDDGCAGMCGECPEVPCDDPCGPSKCWEGDCEGKQCGPDGMGGSCGECDMGWTCVEGLCAFHSICSKDGWCWHNPLPQGHDLRAVWGSGPDDVIAVGAYGTILRYDGTGWTRECCEANGLGAALLERRLSWVTSQP